MSQPGGLIEPRTIESSDSLDNPLAAFWFIAKRFIFRFVSPRGAMLYDSGGSGAPRWDMMIVTTTNEIAGYRVTSHLGLVRGITVRSRSAIGNLLGGLQSVFGGKLSVYVQLAENARQEAFDLMCEHAQSAGANAIIGMRYDANEIMDGVTEVLAYGTAVMVEKQAS
jgi:uncharacterized protein YbjQ (UPF0145 family)